MNTQNKPHLKTFTVEQKADLDALINRFKSEKFRITDIGEESKRKSVILWPGCAVVNRCGSGETVVSWYDRLKS